MHGVVAEGLVKRFGNFTALKGVDFTVPEATLVGLLGPNGAGKTTTIRILTTLLRPDGGHATVAGFDVVRQPQLVRSVIGLTGQFAAIDEDLTGRENLVLVGRLGRMGRTAAGNAPRSCSTRSDSSTPPTARCARTPAACAAGPTSPRASWSRPRCSSSTSRRPGSTRAAASACGT